VKVLIETKKQENNTKIKKWMGLFLTEEEINHLLNLPVESLQTLSEDQKEKMPFFVFDLFYVGMLTEGWEVVEKSGIVFSSKITNAEFGNMLFDLAADVWEIMHSEQGSESVKSKTREQIKQLCGGDS
jgi:hypothetical protein